MRFDTTQVVRSDPSLVNGQAPLGDALMVLTMEEAEELLGHRQLAKEFYDAALPRGAALPFFPDSQAAYASSDGEGESEAAGEAESEGLFHADAEEVGGGDDVGAGAGGFDSSQMPDDDTGWSWLASEDELRTLGAKDISTLPPIQPAVSSFGAIVPRKTILSQDRLGTEKRKPHA